MLVDPNTGTPIGQQLSPNSLGGQFAMDAAAYGNFNQEDIPLFYDMAASFPTATASMGWNISRVSNTIVSGSRSRAQNARGFRQTFNPLAWRRLSQPANIDPTMINAANKLKALEKGQPIPKRGVYSPFNFLSRVGNSIYQNAHRAPLIGKQAASAMASAKAIDDTIAFSPGTFGRIAAGGRIQSIGADRLMGKTGGNILGAIKGIDPNSYAAISDHISGIRSANIAGGASDDALRAAYRGGIGSTVQGSVSGRMVGFIDAFETLGQSGKAGYNALQAQGVNNAAYRAGLQGGAKAFNASGSVGQWMARKGVMSGAARAAGPVGWVLLAKDLATMGGKLVGSGINTAIDAGRSVQGSIGKPVFGMGFQDNTIAATSRQRGVQAISNSRLNMRSALGAEASFIHASFG